ncbi:MAG: hypothetical protein A2085_00155 [Gemmatimonadetes bacterium GWC2_71_10]|nr:MAG: hypothetical protein A2085_00155 [Gemmatimonadetes bacterium GWC2_71_10]
MSRDDDAGRAIVSGARRSWEACSLPANDPLPLRLWIRHKWKIVAVAIFLVLDFVLLGGLGSKIATHF